MGELQLMRVKLPGLCPVGAGCMVDVAITGGGVIPGAGMGQACTQPLALRTCSEEEG